MRAIELSDFCVTVKYFCGLEEASDASPSAGKSQKNWVFVQTLIMAAKEL